MVAAKKGKSQQKKVQQKNKKLTPQKRSLSKWSYSENGYAHFIEQSIAHYKAAATKAEKEGLTEVYKIFSKRVEELEDDLRSYRAARKDTPNKAENKKRKK